MPKYTPTTKEDSHFSWFDVLRSFWFFYKDQGPSFFFWIVALFLVNFYQLVPPLILGKLIDILSTPSSKDTFYFIVLLIGFAGFVHIATSLIRLHGKNIIGDHKDTVFYKAKVKGFEKLLEMSLHWHSQESAGNKVQKISAGINASGRLMQLLTNDIFYGVTTLVGTLVFFMIKAPILAVLVLAYVLCFFTINKIFYSKEQELWASIHKSQESSSGKYYDGLNNLVTIKSLGASSSFQKAVHATEQNTLDLQMKARRLNNTKWRWFQGVNAVVQMIALAYVSHGVLQNIFSIGSVLIFFNYMQSITRVVGDMTSYYEDLVSMKIALGRMMPIYWSKDDSYFGEKTFPNIWDTLSFDSVDFSYKATDTKEKLHDLKGITLTIKRGEKIGIVGRSGSGKSTFAKLLMGLYRADSGRIMIGDAEFYSLNHEHLLEKMAIVLQDSEMFNMTAKENITLLKKVSPELLASAIVGAQLENVVAKLPDGLETLIGEKGYKLSGGERQRIGIARAICKNPEIFIFDEATSALDSKTESHIQHALERVLKDKTVISIAHRISTLENCDRIYVFEKGRIVESGDFHTLLKDQKSKFYLLNKKQKV